MKHFFNALILIFSLILQSTVMQFLGIIGVIPNIILAATVSMALCSDNGMEALLYGLCAGLIYDIAWSRVFGLHALLFMYIATAVFWLSRYVYKKNITVSIIFTLVMSILYDTVFFVVSFMIFGKGNFLYTFFRIIVPAAAYTAFVQIFVYMIVKKINKRGEEV